jgi:hypothetical protein
MPFLRYVAKLKEAEAGPLTLALPRPIDQSAQFALSLAFVGFLPSPRSQCVKERETSENVETRLVTGDWVLWTYLAIRPNATPL